MPGDTGPTTQEVDYLNNVLAGRQADPSTGQVIQQDDGQQKAYQQQMRDAIAGAVMQQGGGGGYNPYAGYGGGGGGGDPYAAYRAAMASRASQPQANPYAAYYAAMAGGGGGGAASHAGQWYDSSVGIGENPWKTGPEPNRIAEALAWQEANPYDQYFAPRGPISGSGDDFGWQQGLQPWQGGSSGTLPGSGMNSSGFIGGGSQMRADPSYWGYTGPGTGWGTSQNAQILWEQLRRANPGLYEQLGGDAAAAAGVAAGAGPGGTGSGAGGSGAGVGTGSGGGSSPGQSPSSGANAPGNISAPSSTPGYGYGYGYGNTPSSGVVGNMTSPDGFFGAPPSGVVGTVGEGFTGNAFGADGFGPNGFGDSDNGWGGVGGAPY